MMFFCLLLLFSCAIVIDANGRESKVCNLGEIGALCNAANELYQPREILWSGHPSSITLQVKDAELKRGKTGRVYHVVRKPTKLMDRQVKKRSTGARRLMKRGVAGTDKRVRKGTLFTHQLARQGLVMLDNQVVKGTKMAHDYLTRTGKSLDDKIVAGTRTTHHKVKHTILPIDKGIVHGSSKAYAMAKKRVTAVDKRIKHSARAVDQQLASDNMKGVPVTVPMKLFLRSVFKKGKKAKSTPALPAAANEPEPEPEPVAVADISVAESVSVAASPTENEMKDASVESVKDSTEGIDDHEVHLHESTDHEEEKAHERDSSVESFKDETASDLDIDDIDIKHEDHDHSHDHVEENGHNHLQDDGHDHVDENLEDIDHINEADHFDDHNNTDNEELHDPFDELDHDHEKEINGPDGHKHESMSFDGQPRNANKKSKKKRYFQDKIRQAVPRASSKMRSGYGKSGLPKNLSRSLTKISRPYSLKSLARMTNKSSKLLSRNADKALRSLPKGVNKSSQMLSKSVGPRSLRSLTLSKSVNARSLTSPKNFNQRSLTKLKGVKAFSKKKLSKSLDKVHRSQAALKSRIQ